jgi:cytochrome c-type biogenesis protein
MEFGLIIPAFIAGLLTFLAPCTFPLVPGYLAFISGVSQEELKNPETQKRARRKIFFNGVFYVIGFSAVFILLGSLFGLGGAALVQYRVWLSRIGGLFVIFFGLFLIGLIKLPFLTAEKQFSFGSALKPGNPLSSFIFGSTFAFGWTPCVGPVLGSVLLLASTSATVLQGAFLLAVFSLGLAVPFLAIALGIGSATKYMQTLEKYVKLFSIIGGVFLVFLGILLLTDQLNFWIGLAFRWFGFIEYQGLLDYL